MASQNPRIVLVTGASRGLGRSIARGFGSTGATVFVTARDAAALHGTVAEIGAAGGRGIAIACDHRDDAAVAATIARLADDTGGVSISSSTTPRRSMRRRSSHRADPGRSRWR